MTWNTIRRFAATDEVHVASLYHHPEERAFLQSMREHCASAEAFPAHGKWNLAVMLRSLLSSWPYKAHRFFNPDMHAYVQHLIHVRQIEVLYAQNFYTTPYVGGDEACLRLHYKENVEGNVLLRYSRAHRNQLVRAAAYLEGWRTRAFERRACSKFHHVMTISPLDRDTLQNLGVTTPLLHQRPGVDVQQYPMLDEPEGPPTLVFTGTMSYYPNADGVANFLQHCWPRIRREVPGVRFTIVGASPPDAIRTYDGREGVTVTGHVPEVEPFLRESHVYLVPLRVGGGIRLKILEAMASGRAIVSTPVGCEGLDGVDGQHLRIAEMPNAFADATISLLQHPETRSRLRTKARELAETVYDWDRVVATQRQAVARWLEDWRQHSPADPSSLDPLHPS